MVYYKSNQNGGIGVFKSDPGIGWTKLTQEEIDYFLLKQAKLAKLEVLKIKKYSFCNAGFLYSENTYCLSDASTSNIILKNSLPPSATDRYKYYDNAGSQINFTNQVGWNVFFNAIVPEKDRIMRYYCSTKTAINEAADISALHAIIINFSA